MAYKKKYPDTIVLTCVNCGRSYTYNRASRSGMTYAMAPDEIPCACFLVDPRYDPLS